MRIPGFGVEDGVSSGGTLGVGLGVVQRMSDEFGIRSRVASVTSEEPPGTIVAAVVGPVPSRVFAIRRRLMGESACGDDHFIRVNGDVLVAVIDGLGHGPEAAEASSAATGLLASREEDRPLQSTFDALDDRLRGTRGAAGSIARIADDEIEWAGVGNVVARTIPAPCQHLIPRHGTIGVVARRGTGTTVPRPHGGLMVMASDGISDRWSANVCDSTSPPHPLVLAALLHRDFGRDRDDATVIVAAL
jgi:hypothetical protein